MEEKNETTEQQKALTMKIVSKKESGETLTDDEQLIYDTYKKVQREEKSWVARNGFWVVLVVVIFLFKMCADIQSH